MLRSYKFTRLFAILALLAWSNVQAMACCWTMPKHAPTEKAEVTASMATDHSCCPGGESKSDAEEPVSSQASNDDCGMTQHRGTALCCTHTESAEEATSFSPQFSFVQLALIAYMLPALSERPPEAAPPSPSLASSGPPRYLTLERILI